MNSLRYPTWASLAADYLAAMASSVSSERVFSSAGITVTKRRNRLQGDIIEATQVLKAAIRNDLLVRPHAPSSTLEEILEQEDNAETITARTTDLMQASMKLGEAMYAASQAEGAGDGEPAAADAKKEDDVIDADFQEVDENERKKRA